MGERIRRISAKRVWVVAGGRLRLRVEGVARGYLQLGRDRRWVWGKYDESFDVAVTVKQTEVAVVVTEPWGRTVQRVDCEGAIRIVFPAYRRRRFTVRTAIHNAIPKLRGLDMRAVQKRSEA